MTDYFTHRLDSIRRSINRLELVIRRGVDDPVRVRREILGLQAEYNRVLAQQKREVAA